MTLLNEMSAKHQIYNYKRAIEKSGSHSRIHLNREAADHVEIERAGVISQLAGVSSNRNRQVNI